ncbi:MAG: sugar transferase, partial [Planctomycetota bacterium]|nr:sugar transferase [Planctomycetota bacterium]
MIKINEQVREDVESSASDRPTVWGFQACELHDAYWRAHGVQCIVRGQTTSIQSGADLYLLIEPDQLVVFDVMALADRLTWRAARVTRLRVVDNHDDPYGELLDLDDEGFVRRIDRRYRNRSQSAYRVILTRHRRLAQMWMQATERRSGWRRISRAVGLAHIDNWRCDGGCYTRADPAEERRLIERLVSVWPRPDLVIDGIHEVRQSVWVRQGDELSEDCIAVGPAWLGSNTDPRLRACIIGPAWLADQGSRESDMPLPPLNIRDICDVDPGDVSPKPESSRRDSTGYAVSKRLFDLVFSASGIVLASPLMVIVALLIYISDGRPIFYGGTRQAKGGKPFRCWKFRTMYRNADEIKHTLTLQNAADGPQFFMENDPRVMLIGHFLRRYHLDELPQLWNVLLGQMSLVGPRPSPDCENQKCPTWREIRL